MSAPRMSVEIEGLDQIEQRFAERVAAVMPEPIVFEVKAGGARGGAKNAMIAHVLASMGRNFAWVNPKTKAQIGLAARGLFSTAAAAAATKRNAIETIKALLLVGIGENVQAQRNPGGGTFRSLTANYAAQKRRLHGFVTPIGKASGDLLGGLHVEVRRP
jgi:hypothetical protein